MKTNPPNRARRSAAGFTLIELMVVIAIIGILATIVVPRFMSSVGQSQRVAAMAQIKSFQTALTQYKLYFKHYPTTSEGLEALLNTSKGSLLDSATVPLDPWNNKWVYTCPGAHGDFDIISYGADGQAGGEGENADVESWNMTS